MNTGAHEIAGRKPSPFAHILKRLLDETGLNDRKGWAEFLGVTETEIEAWLCDEQFPTHDIRHGKVCGYWFLNFLWTCLTAYDLAPGSEALLAEFERIAKMDSREVTPFGHLTQPSIWIQMNKSCFDEEFSERFLLAQEQKLLSKR